MRSGQGRCLWPWRRTGRAGGGEGRRRLFAVALLQEGLDLREAGIEQPILVLGSMSTQPGVADFVVRYDISHAVFDEERLMLLNEAAVKQGKKAKIHIAVDTGMHRIGVHVKNAGVFAQKRRPIRGLR